MTRELQKGSGVVKLKLCAGCGQKIQDRFLLSALDGFWHSGCLTCSFCSASLAHISSSCFTRNGLILCRSDYIRLFGLGGVCRGCSRSIPAREMVMKAKSYIFHIKCFVCSVCCKQLQPGDHFYCEDGDLFCDQDRPAAPESSENKSDWPVQDDQQNSPTDHLIDR